MRGGVTDDDVRHLTRLARRLDETGYIENAGDVAFLDGLAARITPFEMPGDVAARLLSDVICNELGTRDPIEVREWIAEARRAARGVR